MFTGIVEEVGTVTAIEVADGHAELVVAATTVTSDAREGDSIAVDGCCLTVARLRDDGFVADLMAETLRATALGDLAVGDGVNLERAMAADGRFGGHVVQGHVDAVGTVTGRQDDPGTTWLSVRAPAEVAPYLVAKGSITLAGASLTVVDVTDHDDRTATLRVGLIPHTLAHTTFGRLAVGDRVNLEADVLAKYVERITSVHVGGDPVPGGSSDAAAPSRPDTGSHR
ncbi:riboflavin synthase [Salsipaludibacter albus]|uniref:riboflavin synthase n=1 Tax=Salsipaludibacter albus TaxID=2849650 RepID=UPI001EE42B1C|nr:riboflavin synthase [Salsipaludibacter albus]MBY5163774.1 riboflavin synthase [Salsipaludibacter albus]